MATPYYPQSGETDVNLYVDFWSLTDGTPVTSLTAASTSMSVMYHRPGETLTSVTLSNLSSLNAAHTDGGMIHVTMGTYRLCMPDAAFASGAPYAAIMGRSQVAVMTKVIAHLNLDTAADVADAVWDEPTTGHQTSGTAGIKQHNMTFTTPNLLDTRVNNVAGVTLQQNGTGNQLIGST